MSDQQPLNYREAGVDIDAGNRLVEAIKPAVADTQRAEVIGGLGGFGGLFRLPVEDYREPVLVSGTDGVGTKLRLAIDAGRLDSVGTDLVAMCVNDILVLGAQPLFFLDYYATGKLDNTIAAAVINGVAAGCKTAGAALLGGETAEMPGFYPDGDFDIAGFCVGVVERDCIIDGSTIAPGDTILGLASSGPHANGYSLIRKILEVGNHPLDTAFAGSTLADALLQPTRIYVAAIQALLQATGMHGAAHITGGGLTENIARVLPAATAARLDVNAWPQPEIFRWLQQQGRIDSAEMWRTFNCGIGMAVIVAAQDADAATQTLRNQGEQVWPIGQVVTRGNNDPAVMMSA